VIAIINILKIIPKNNCWWLQRWSWNELQ